MTETVRIQKSAWTIDDHVRQVDFMKTHDGYACAY